MLIIIISRSSLKLDHVGSKTRLLGHQATQVSDLGPLWPSCQKIQIRWTILTHLVWIYPVCCFFFIIFVRFFSKQQTEYSKKFCFIKLNDCLELAIWYGIYAVRFGMYAVR